MNTNIILWLYGLPSAGKSTISRELMKRLHNFIILDGDDLRKTIGYDLGYTEEDRDEEARRIVRLINSNYYNKNIILSTNSVSEYNRNIFRGNLDNLVEIYVKCPLIECIKRDVNGLYKKYFNREIRNMPGLDIRFEQPYKYDLVVDTNKQDIKSCVNTIIKYLKEEHLHLVQQWRY